MALLAGPVGGQPKTAPEPRLFLGRLEDLAAELGKRGLHTRLISSPGRVPSLHVINPVVSRLSEDVYVGRSQDGLWWFWWPWAERIAACDAVTVAADLIAKVLDASV